MFVWISQLALLGNWSKVSCFLKQLNSSLLILQLVESANWTIVSSASSAKFNFFLLVAQLVSLANLFTAFSKT